MRLLIEVLLAAGISIVLFVGVSLWKFLRFLEEHDPLDSPWDEEDEHDEPAPPTHRGQIHPFKRPH